MIGLSRSVAAACLLGLALPPAGLLLGAPSPAYAAPPSGQTTELCGSTKVSCSIQADQVLTEGGTREVAVTGAPGVTVEVQALRVTLDGDRIVTAVPHGSPVEIGTDAGGFGATSLTLPALADGEAGGTLLLTLADVAPAGLAGADLSEVLGTWSVLAARTPHVQGDGYAEAKPVGEPVFLVVEAAVPGARFEVELQEAGAWRRIGVGAARCQAAGEPCQIGYEIPRGLPASPHDVRLVNLATGTPVATWTVLPSADGEPKPLAALAEPPAIGTAVANSATAAGAVTNAVPRPRSRNLDIPDVGSNVEGAGGPIVHPRGTVLAVATGSAVIVVALALGGVHRASTRNRVLPETRQVER